MRITLVMLTVALLGTCGNACAEEDVDKWEYRLTPYVWLPTIDGTSKYNLPPGGGGSPSISVGPTDWTC